MQVRNVELRDWFAGQAMQMGWIRSGHWGSDRVAEICYRFADSMMKAREKQPTDLCKSPDDRAASDQPSYRSSPG